MNARANTGERKMNNHEKKATGLNQDVSAGPQRFCRLAPPRSPHHRAWTVHPLRAAASSRLLTRRRRSVSVSGFVAMQMTPGAHSGAKWTGSSDVMAQYLARRRVP